jgi:hypothetical protein
MQPAVEARFSATDEQVEQYLELGRNVVKKHKCLLCVSFTHP